MSRRASPWADAVSLALNPSAVTGAFFVLLAVAFEPPGPGRLAFAVIAVTFGTVVPLVVLFVLVARRRVSGLEMRLRAERGAVYRWCSAGYALGTGLLFVAGAAWPLWGVMALHVPNTAALALLNRRWKVSVHAMALSGMWVAAILLFGPVALPAGGVVALAAWGRWAAGAHSPGELAAGATLGALLTAVGLAVLTVAMGG